MCFSIKYLSQIIKGQNQASGQKIQSNPFVVLKCIHTDITMYLFICQDIYISWNNIIKIKVKSFKEWKSSVVWGQCLFIVSFLKGVEHQFSWGEMQSKMMISFLCLVIRLIISLLNGIENLAGNHPYIEFSSVLVQRVVMESIKLYLLN